MGGDEWYWRVLKAWQVHHDAQAARWFCSVTSPHTYGMGELGDVYVHEIVTHAQLVAVDGREPTDDERKDALLLAVSAEAPPHLM